MYILTLEKEQDDYECTGAVRDQCLYQLVLDPLFVTNQPDGRVFAPSPRYEAIQKKIHAAFWKQLGFEIHQEYTPCYSKVTEAVRLIHVRLYAMLQQQGLAKLPDYHAELAVLQMETAVGFVYHEQNMAIFNEIAASLLAYHYYGSERFKCVPQWTARRNVTLGNQIFEQISLLSQIESQMHVRLEGLYIIITEVILQDRRDIFQQNASGWLQKGGIPYLRARFMPQSLAKTQVWLRRHGVGQNVQLTFSRAMVDLATNAPAMLAVFPETFANDKRDFLAFYNQMQYFVDLCVTLERARGSSRKAEEGRVPGQKLSGQQIRKYDPMRMQLIGRLVRHMEHCILVPTKKEEDLGDALLVTANECLNQNFAKFMHRFCRIADVNWQIYSEHYTEAFLIKD
jgi:hypothetical protein